MIKLVYCVVRRDGVSDTAEPNAEARLRPYRQ